MAALTRLAGSDYILVGSWSGKLADDAADVSAAVAACHAPLGVSRAVAVLGGGVSPENAAAQIARAGTRSGVMALLGSAAYAYPGGPREAVAAIVAAVRP
jgi:ribulose 1,5-bisphosphate carboxylase large subunit-like protein